MFLGIITLLSALFISGVAGWFSIIGLTAIFPGSFLPIVVMGVSLEVGKLVTASWLYNNWDSLKGRGVLLKYYLTGAVVGLMLITSMGIFGFLSKAHLDQSIPVGEVSATIERIDARIVREQRRISDAELVLSQLDAAVQTLIDYDRIRGVDGSIAVRDSQRVERNKLRTEIDSAQDIIDSLNDEKAPFSKEFRSLEAEVGPVKYIAELIYGESSNELAGRAVGLVIILLVFVFDPLAVLLVIAGNTTIRKHVGSIKWEPPTKMHKVFKMKNPFYEKENIEIEEEIVPETEVESTAKWEAAGWKDDGSYTAPASITSAKKID